MSLNRAQDYNVWNSFLRESPRWVHVQFIGCPAWRGWGRGRRLADADICRRHRSATPLITPTMRWLPRAPPQHPSNPPPPLVSLVAWFVLSLRHRSVEYSSQWTACQNSSGEGCLGDDVKPMNLKSLLYSLVKHSSTHLEDKSLWIK